MLLAFRFVITSLGGLIYSKIAFAANRKNFNDEKRRTKGVNAKETKLKTVK